MVSSKKYLSIVSACQAFLSEHGDTYRGVGWTKSQEDADTRYKVMLEVIKQRDSSKVTLLDFGCGASHLYEYIIDQELYSIEYCGLDISDTFIALSKQKFPSVDYYLMDVLEGERVLPTFDYIVFNGVFTMKCDLSFDEMYEYFQTVVETMFAKARVGIAFNIMSKQVDWERDDLFHLPFDVLASFLSNKISRHFTFRHDYGLYEYTTYVYK
jgi:SAM-dependent methyltransferase